MTDQSRPQRLSDEQVAATIELHGTAEPGMWQVFIASEVRERRDIEAKVRALHTWHHDEEIGVGWCVHCGFGNTVDNTPRCPTIRLLDGET